MTFCSGIHAIEQSGAHPILVDVEPDTLDIDPAKVGDAIEILGRQEMEVKAILPVHLYGHPCEMDSLIELAQHPWPGNDRRPRDSSGLSWTSDRGTEPPSAHCSVLTCFSLSTKNLTTDGGMLTGPADAIEEARPLEPSWHEPRCLEHVPIRPRHTFSDRPGLQISSSVLTGIQKRLRIHPIEAVPNNQWKTNYYFNPHLKRSSGWNDGFLSPFLAFMVRAQKTRFARIILCHRSWLIGSFRGC